MPEIPCFRNASLLRLALTHSSYLNEHSCEREDNERLEFLGDAVLNFLNGEFLYQRYPKMSEGELTRRRSALVDEKQLAKFAKELRVGNLIRLSRGTAVQDGGRQNESLLSSTFEAIIGAYFLDSGIEAVRAFVKPLLTSVVESLPSSQSNLDSKSQFQQWAQVNFEQVPQYVIIDQFGPPHAKKFTAEVRVGGKVYGVATERSKKAAEKCAASAALKKVRHIRDSLN